MRRGLFRGQEELYVGLDVEIGIEERIVFEVLRRQLHQLDVVGRQRGFRGKEAQFVEQGIEAAGLEWIGDGGDDDVLDVREPQREVDRLVGIQSGKVWRGFDRPHHARLQLRPADAFHRIGAIRLASDGRKRRKTIPQPGVDRLREFGSKDVGGIAGDEDERHG